MLGLHSPWCRVISTRGVDTQNPPHPGTVLRDMLRKRSASSAVFAKQVGVEEPLLSGILAGSRDIDVSLSAAISSALGEDRPEHWYFMQMHYDQCKKDNS
jgi:plasmid maintenance system antidote protein VapI